MLFFLATLPLEVTFAQASFNENETTLLTHERTKLLTHERTKS